MLKDFKAFILRGNVLDLAVAVIIGAAFGDVVKSVVDLLTNVLAIPGKTDFGHLSFSIRGGTFHYGAVINAVIAFLAIAAVIFFAVIQPLNKLSERRKAGIEVEPVARPEDILLLEEIRDLLRAQRPS